MQILSLLTLATTVLSKNIVLTNDDGWAATPIRALYRDLTDAGHNVLMVAPVTQRSGWSGRFQYSYSKELLEDGQFNYRNKGEPAWGYEEDDNKIWYMNGTPAGCVGFALDVVIPKYFPELNNSIDLVVGGVNEGVNNSPQTFTVSGTIGATYEAVYRGLPAIAFSGSNSNNSFFKDDLNDDPLNPFNIYAKKSVQLIEEIFTKQGDNDRALPLGVGLNVNFPKAGYDDETCTNPVYTKSRIAGTDSGAYTIYLNETTGLLQDGPNDLTQALGVCYNGPCNYPSETEVVGGKVGHCKSSISTFSIDYDANSQLQAEVDSLIGGVFNL
ncbi:hypothetical protein CLIB1444_05S04610 [[Candida] jaroonii]|uniref:Uncharacterized protein n=1 Tax=[Candida] jaroonii TaxID=467808 RepID=A0ACA9Y8Q9_9ASCO|nr:hypothetical protein CLIB1444_05S04610 [[Candida] jaroonii]